MSFSSVWAEDIEKESLDLFIEQALGNSPKIQAAYNNWKAAEYNIKQVSGLPDPVLHYTYFGENIQTRVGPQERKYGISQKIPFPGKLNLKRKAESEYAKMRKEEYESLKREVIKNIKFIYYDIFWVDKIIQITKEEKIILENLEQVIKAKYESNLTPQQDVIKVQVELSRLIEKLFILEQNRKSLAAKMNSVLNRAVDTEIEKITSIEEPEDLKYELSKLREIAKESQQDLLVASLDIERAKYKKSLARLNYTPDLTVGFDYIQIGSGSTTMSNDGQDAWTGTVSINVPLWFDKSNADLRSKNAALKASRNNYKDIENKIIYEIEDVYFKIMSYKSIISLYKTALIPQTEQAFEVAEIGYETGTVDFLNLLDSERILLQTKLAYYKGIVDYQKSISYLERIIGKDL